FSVLLHDYEAVDAMTEKLYFEFNELSDPYDQHYYVSSLKEQNIQIFSWLDMLDMNVWIILGLMAIVSGFTMISGLFIIILERINMIGVLKALGATNFFIRKTFLYVSLFLVGKGMLFGNLVGLSICLIQSRFHVIKLNPQDYYISSVPIDLSLWAWILLNIGCLAVSLLMLLGASYIVSMIRPARSIRFE
ncbi:MAG TPA: ABC transporter permease, partial [Candidatus Gallibacteroides avistercoris]|nr:ABC transporter permease [Candidatus Gallibacteroides avistercoris]